MYKKQQKSQHRILAWEDNKLDAKKDACFTVLLFLPFSHFKNLITDLIYNVDDLLFFFKNYDFFHPNVLSTMQIIYLQ